VSGSVDTPGVAAAIAAGAVGSVPKSTSFDGLLDVVLAAAAGEPVMTEVEQQDWVTRHRGYLAQERELARRLGRLSAREREVLDLLAEGLRAAEIAEHFMVSITTVRTQIRNMHTKLEVQSQLGAVALVRQARQW
jgi:DNA-binding NarL/FixJ family response regulator